MSLLIALLLSPANAPIDSPLETRVFLTQTGDADDPSAQIGFSLSHWHSFIPPDALPPAARELGTHEASLLIALDSTGAITACTPGASDPSAVAFADAACAALRANARFAPRYTAPSVGVSSRRIFRVRSVTKTVAEWTADKARISPAPPPPPGVLFSLDQPLEWPPQFGEYSNLTLGPPPAVTARAVPETRGPRGTTGLSLGIASDGERRCVVTESSGDAARDAAACRIAQTLTVTYARPCDECFAARVPMLLEWDGSKSRLRLPAQSQERAQMIGSGGLRAGQFGPSRPPGDRQRVTFFVAVDAKGKATGCRVSSASGDDPFDERVCAALVSGGRFVAGGDIFGRPMSGEAIVTIRINDLFPET